MNERNKELAREAGLLAHNPDGPPTKLEKFAELIVRECANIAHNKQYKHSPAHTTGDCATAIKQHFGVEE